ncbi:TRAP transporter small permease [Roseospira marina]|uniref:TRAP transporter small permease protein n=1 Tax=Roseospira marina TaxID=140057 RepID=A0A5M6IF76_9PROT|nr:TRAP transporter small permease [Roseospira marina]KAA5606782.1 TRAP transporter small permease [Roseospira marina]MBB4313796.1 TRAP-type C4-dicarboxylate transport system permease small subunit [Roseospira marina]MBB5086958.1 TRAP-type C4-dicarboxylate transport system permease small subunit [Roseospira marina]
MTRAFAALAWGLDRFYVACGAVAALLLVVLTGLILASIVSRLIGVYLGGVNAYAGYAMAAGAFFGMPYAFRSGAHIRVTLLLTNLTGWTRWAFELWARAIIAAAAGYMAVYFGRLTYYSYVYGDISQGADATPLWIPQSVMAVGAVCFAIATADSAVRCLVEGRHSLTAPEADGGRDT